MSIRRFCKHCGASIQWGRTEGGRWQPLNLDGSVHFPDCRRHAAQEQERVTAEREEIKAWYERMQTAERPTR